MPSLGNIDTTYPNRMRDINIELCEPFQGAKIHHKMRCLQCNHEWIATPIAKLQNFNKHKLKGCPICCRSKYTERILEKRQQNLQLLKERGLEVLSDYDGRYVQDVPGQSIPVMVTVKNTKCGHIFTSSSKNLLTRNVECSICAKMYRTNILNDVQDRKHQNWAKTATSWQLYKSEVKTLSRQTYKANKDSINPNNLPTGTAGTHGAYHLDHIVSIRYCFEHYVPAEICADVTNLQMLPWITNLAFKAKLKGKIPVIFEQFGINIPRVSHGDNNET